MRLRPGLCPGPAGGVLQRSPRFPLAGFGELQTSLLDLERNGEGVERDIEGTGNRKGRKGKGKEKREGNEGGNWKGEEK